MTKADNQSESPAPASERRKPQGQTRLAALSRHLPGGRRLRWAGRSFLLAALVGVIAGCAGVAFHVMSHGIAAFTLEWLVGYHQSGPANETQVFELGDAIRPFTPWLLLIVPTVGGLLSGWLVYTFAPEAEGHGTDSAIRAYHHNRGVIRPRVPIIKMVASAITLGTGGSGGREGPIAQIGAGFGSWLGTRLKLTDAERRVLLAAGLGAGIGAIFHAPLAGAIFAVEVLYREADFETEALIPAFIATTVAYCTFSLVITMFFGTHAFAPLFAVEPGIAFHDPALLGPLAILALTMALASWVYVRGFYGIHALFKRLPISNKIKPAIGAFLTGAVALTLYYGIGAAGYEDHGKDALSVLSFGYGFLQRILANPDGSELFIGMLLLIGVGKILTTSLTIGSGGSGGVFGPSMVIGGALGGVMGLIFKDIWPQTVDRIDVFVILGMASFFAAAARTPVSTLIMVSELTSSYALLLPSMWVCALAYLVSWSWTIYREQVQTRIDSPAHRGDFLIDVLEGMSVTDVLTPADKVFTTVPLDMPLLEVTHMITGTKQTCFPVVDPRGDYYGVFELNDIREFLYESEEVGRLAVAQDLALRGEEPLMLQMDLGQAIRRFAEVSYDELPVVDENEPKTVIALLRRHDIITAYNRRLANLRMRKESHHAF